MSTRKTFTIGTRKSQLALVQTNEVQKALQRAYPNIEFSILGITTTGDQILNKPLYQIGEKSLFTKELEVALENKTVDLVVHSLKDLPTTLPKGMTVGAMLKREDPNDALIIKGDLAAKSLEELPKGSIIGTSSVRRSSQLKHAFPDLIFQNIRGNLDTRLAKLDNPDGQYSAIILAVAGLVRLGLNHRISQILPSNIMLHAVGQGAIAVECRDDDKDTIELLSVLEDKDTRLRCTAERSLLRDLEGGCSVPIGVNTNFIEEKEGKRMLRLESLVAQLDGSKIIRAEVTKYVDGIDEANELGKEVSKILIERGAISIIEELKH
ncbi:porphobilinogen deaminase, dipyromethane cofactor binding domain-containing protein [Gigaspora rosea]|uniref:hydroxymethylbilane synthase n=1 Tax=Gigaspora rosea TaxID=44941 RepID=A0A397V3G0_9GLOM|nr:porphobilinogen deaminase, dipyromethane cofactor binding domain-containing protein [Gigaspora rosea]